MKPIIITLLTVSVLSTGLTAQRIQDVTKVDGSYPAIKKSIDKGYLSLFSDNTFRPNTSLTRKEIALVIDQLLKEIKQSSLSITKTELAELNNLSKSFKSNLSSLEITLSTLETSQKIISEEQKTIQHDFSNQHERIKTLEKRQTLLWIGIGLAAVLGIAI